MIAEEEPDWDKIVERHGERVFRIAQRILGSAQDAEDVAQDVFVEAFQLHRAGPRQSWTGLLVRIATLRSIDRLRQKRPTQALRDQDRPTTAGPLDELVARELADQLRIAISQLPDQQATVFVMFHFESLKRQEIASSLGISEEAVSTTLYKARQRLLARLAIANQGEIR